jgi:hypothetical protein
MTNQDKQHGNSTMGIYTPSGLPLLIEEARSGLDCKCVCIDCDKQLVAVIDRASGFKSYFRHHTESGTRPCLSSKTGKMTEIHIRLSRAIKETKHIVLPPIYITKPCPHYGYSYKPFTVFKGGPIHFDNVVEEYWMDNMRPDCKANIGDKQFLIEVKVTHAVDTEKSEKIRDKDIDCIELLVNKKTNFSNPIKVITNPNNYEWVYSTKRKKEESKQAAEDWFRTEEIKVLGLIEAEKQRVKDVHDSREAEHRYELIDLARSKRLERWQQSEPTISDIKKQIQDNVSKGKSNQQLKADNLSELMMQAGIGELGTFRDTVQGLEAKYSKARSHVIKKLYPLHKILIKAVDRGLLFHQNYPYDHPDDVLHASFKELPSGHFLTEKNIHSVIDQLPRILSDKRLILKSQIEDTYYRMYLTSRKGIRGDENKIRKLFKVTQFYETSQKKIEAELEFMPSREVVDNFIENMGPVISRMESDSSLIESASLELSEMTESTRIKVLDIINEFTCGYSMPDWMSEQIIKNYIDNMNFEELFSKIESHYHQVLAENTLPLHIAQHKADEYKIYEGLKDMDNEELKDDIEPDRYQRRAMYL